MNEKLVEKVVIVCVFSTTLKTRPVFSIVSEGQIIAAGPSEFSPLQDIFNRLSQAAKLCPLFTIEIESN